MQKNIQFRLNTQDYTITLEKETLALDWIRNTALLKGTKEGCREGDCGACMIILGEQREGEPVYRAVTSCTLGLSDLDGKHAITIEGIAADGLTPVMQAFLENGASQCGFCSPGFIIALTAMFIEGGPIDYHRALVAIEGNLCRCTGYGSIRRAAQKLAQQFPTLPAVFEDRLAFLAESHILPSSLAQAMRRLPEPVQEPIPATKILGGGTDFFVQHPDPDDALSPHYSDLEPDAHRIFQKDNSVIIGSALTMREFFSSSIIRRIAPGIEAFEACIASLPIRNRATLAGNIGNASPIADMTTVLLALGAELILEKPDGSKRTIALEHAFIGYKKLAFENNERIASIILPANQVRISFEKVSKRERLDIATINTACVVQENTEGIIITARLALGGVAPVPIVVQDASRLLQNKKPEPALIRTLAQSAQDLSAPISDVRGTAEYRKRLVYRLILAHAVRLWPQMEEELLP